MLRGLLLSVADGTVGDFLVCAERAELELLTQRSIYICLP